MGCLCPLLARVVAAHANPRAPDYGSDFPEALSHIVSGKVDLKPLASHRIKMPQAAEAFEWCAKGVDGEGRAVTKVLFEL